MKRRLLFSLAVVLLVAGIAEVTARRVGGKLLPARRSLDAMPGESVPGEPNMVVNVVTGWRPRTGRQFSFGIPGGTVVNSHGLRGPEIPVAKPAGERRVLLVGDSTVFGVLVSDQDTFARQLEAALQGVDPHITVLNGGAPGWSSWQARRALEESLLDYEPDLLVIATLWSDAQGARWPDATRFPAMVPLLARSSAYVLLREWVGELRYGDAVEEVRVGLGAPGSRPPPPNRPGEPPPVNGGPNGPGGMLANGEMPPKPPGGSPVKGPPDAPGGPPPNAPGTPPPNGPDGPPTLRVALPDYEANLAAMASLVAAGGGKTAFLVLPCVRDPADGEVGDFRDKYRDAMRAYATSLDAPIADTPAAFVGTDAAQMFLDEVHPTVGGHTKIAAVLAETLDPWARTPSP